MNQENTNKQAAVTAMVESPKGFNQKFDYAPITITPFQFRPTRICYRALGNPGTHKGLRQNLIYAGYVRKWCYS